MSDAIDFSPQPGRAILASHSLRKPEQRARFEAIRAHWEPLLRAELCAELPTDAHVTAALHVIYNVKCCATPWASEMPTYVPKLLQKLWTQEYHDRGYVL
jgi:hypothetical protein